MGRDDRRPPDQSVRFFFIPVVLLHRLQPLGMGRRVLFDPLWLVRGDFHDLRPLDRHCVVDSYVNPVASSLPQGKFRPPDRLKPEKQEPYGVPVF